MVSLIQKIKRAESPGYARLKHLIKAVLTLSVPSIKWIHLPLYYLYTFSQSVYNTMVSGLWRVPAFAARCVECGKGLKLPNGIPYITGPIKIKVGHNTTILRSTIASGHVNEHAYLSIGSRVTVGYGTSISCSQHVSIGDDTLIAGNCFIADNNGHPIDPELRARHEATTDIRPVHIESNVWLGRNVVILKGVTIGKNSIISANSVVNQDVPPNVIYRGDTVNNNITQIR